MDEKINDMLESFHQLWKSPEFMGHVPTRLSSKRNTCKDHCKKFEFFYGLNIAYCLYAMIDNPSNAIQK